MTEDRPVVLTVEEAARALRVSRSAAYRGVRAGQIPCIRVGRTLRIPRWRLEQLLNDSQGGGEPRTPGADHSAIP
jgi:excisionase family DNA binding protein